MSRRNETAQVIAELAAWVEGQRYPVYGIGNRVLRGLHSSLIGAKPSPKVIAMLAEDVAELERAVRAA